MESCFHAWLNTMYCGITYNRRLITYDIYDTVFKMADGKHVKAIAHISDETHIGILNGSFNYKKSPCVP